MGIVVKALIGILLIQSASLYDPDEVLFPYKIEKKPVVDIFNPIPNVLAKKETPKKENNDEKVIPYKKENKAVVDVFNPLPNVQPTKEIPNKETNAKEVEVSGLKKDVTRNTMKIEDHEVMIKSVYSMISNGLDKIENNFQRMVDESFVRFEKGFMKNISLQMNAQLIGLFGRVGDYLEVLANASGKVNMMDQKLLWLINGMEKTYSFIKNMNETKTNEFIHFVNNFKTELEHLERIQQSLTKFKFDFEKDLHSNQLRYWLKLVGTVDRLQEMVLDVNEVLNKNIREKTGIKPQIDSNVDKMYNSSISLHFEDVQSLTESSIQNTSVIDQISTHSDFNSSLDEKEDDRDLRIQDDLILKSIDFNSQDLYPENILNPNQTYDDKERNTDGEMSELQSESVEQLPLLDELRHLLSDATFHTNSKEVLDPEYLKRLKRNQSWKNDDLKFYNVPFDTQPRLTYEIQMLSNCLEIGVKKYSEISDNINMQVKNQVEIKSVLDRLEESSSLKDWIEIGFYIFCGFMFGLLFGIVATISVTICINKRKQTKVLKRRQVMDETGFGGFGYAMNVLPKSNDKKGQELDIPSDISINDPDIPISTMESFPRTYRTISQRRSRPFGRVAPIPVNIPNPPEIQIHSD